MKQQDNEPVGRSQPSDGPRSEAPRRNRRWDWNNWSVDSQERALILLELMHAISESRKQIHCTCDSGREIDWHGLSYLLRQFLFDVGGQLSVNVPFLDPDVNRNSLRLFDGMQKARQHGRRND